MRRIGCPGSGVNCPRFYAETSEDGRLNHGHRSPRATPAGDLRPPYEFRPEQWIPPGVPGGFWRQPGTRRGNPGNPGRCIGNGSRAPDAPDPPAHDGFTRFFEGRGPARRSIPPMGGGDRLDPSRARDASELGLETRRRRSPARLSRSRRVLRGIHVASAGVRPDRSRHRRGDTPLQAGEPSVPGPDRRRSSRPGPGPPSAR